MFARLKTYSISSIITAVMVGLFSVWLIANGAIWANPTANPPGNNAQEPINVSSDLQQKSGGLILKNIALTASGVQNALLIPSGRVGIGTANPVTTFDLRGGARVIGNYCVGSCPVFQFGKDYRSTTDGFVAAYLYADNDGDICRISGRTHGLSLWRASADNRSGTRLPYDSILMPVKNFEIWRVDGEDVAGSCAYGMMFIPLGEGGTIAVVP